MTSGAKVGNGSGDTIPLRAGVIGAGYFGDIHAGKYMAHPDAKLVGIVDFATDKLVELCSRLHVRALTRADDLWDFVDVVTIATPASTHYQFARQALEKGKHVLVEKPIATSADDAQKLIEIARDKDLILQTGHQERYFFSKVGLLDLKESPKAIRSKRHGPYTGRNIDCSAAMDLMIHDLDMIHRLNAAEISRVAAEGRTTKSMHADVVTAEIELADGCLVELSASRIADDRERVMQLEYQDGIIDIDFINRKVVNTTNFELPDLFSDEIQSTPEVKDPLGHGVDLFLKCVQRGEQPLVRPEEARRAVTTVLSVHAAMAT